MSAPPVSKDPHEALIDLLVADVLARPIGELVSPRAAAESFRKVVLAVSGSEAAVMRIVAPLLTVAEEAANDKRRVRELLAPELIATLRELADWPYTPDRRVVEKLLASDQVKQFARELVAESIEAFTGKLKSPISGIMGFGKAAAETARKSTGALGAFAGSMVASAQDRFSKGSGEVIDAALDALLARLIEQVCDPKHAKEQAALRMALLESGLALRARDLARELERTRPVEAAELIRGHVHAWASRPDAVEEVVQLLDAVLAADFAEPLGEAARAWGVHAAVRGALHDGLGRLLLPFFRSKAFAGWRELAAAPTKSAKEPS